mmetsp:Transcript_12055/g.17309  ORF Transcript_12055/g.17309 Transcript_12055/m.17309 type:complete len:83 (+) Transcript_12055:610-858(+)
MCCAKAGIAAQLCCWIYGLPLVTGHSDDDKQINDTQILRQQQEFGDMDSCVANLTKQTGPAVLQATCVAVVPSGNERAVKVR